RTSSGIARLWSSNLKIDCGSRRRTLVSRTKVLAFADTFVLDFGADAPVIGSIRWITCEQPCPRRRNCRCRIVANEGRACDCLPAQCTVDARAHAKRRESGGKLGRGLRVRRRRCLGLGRLRRPQAQLKLGELSDAHARQPRALRLAAKRLRRFRTLRVVAP